MVKPSPLLSGNWSAITSRIAAVLDLEATARQFKALQRVRKIRTAEALVRLALIWSPGRQSLREAAALAADGGIADMSDKAVEGRLRKMGDWLEHILARLLAGRMGQADRADPGRIMLSLVDGSVICTPGSGDNWRLHARYDPDLGRFADMTLTTVRQAECVTRTRIGPGRIVVMDRGYARVRSFQAILAEGGAFIGRISWRSLALYDAEGERIDVMALLEDGAPPRERVVWVNGIKRGLRLLIRPMPPEIAARQRLRRARKANKRSQKLDPRTSKAAGFLMVLTSLAADTHDIATVCDAYRDRWQVEIGFKRYKTLGRLDELPSSDPVLARTWLLAQLIAAVLTDDLANEIVGFPPWAG
jgi:Transposase DDE domain